MLNILPILLPVIKKVIDVIDKNVEDKDLKEKLKKEIELTILEKEYEQIAKELEAKRDIIVAEAKAESWLTRNWRPITMLTFLFLLVSYWFGLAIPNITADILSEIFSIIKIGLGGYIAGRSAEKIAQTILNKRGE